MLLESAERFLGEHSSSQVARAAACLPSGVDMALWSRVTEELGWQGVAIPEACDGLGLGAVELVILLEKLGARLSPIPFFASALAAMILRTVPTSPEQTRLFKALAGGAVVAFAHTDARPDWNEVGVKVSSAAAPHIAELNGEARFVSAGGVAEQLLVAARGDGGVRLFSIPSDAPGVSVRHRPTVDQTRSLAEVTLTGVLVEPGCELAADWERGLGVSLDMARILSAAEQVGCAQEALDITVAYVGERVQFGRTIASFQAVKHKAADMMLKVESARSLLYYAACTADAWVQGSADDQALREAAAMVASAAGDTAFFVTGTGIQLHGGVGITEEYDIQLYFKRARALEAYLGRPDESRERLAQMLLDDPDLEGTVHAA